MACRGWYYLLSLRASCAAVPFVAACGTISYSPDRQVLKYDAPLLPDGGGFSPELRSFVKDCLTKDYKQRPKYKRLLDHEFIKKSERMRVDVSSWFRGGWQLLVQ